MNGSLAIAILIAAQLCISVACNRTHLAEVQRDKPMPELELIGVPDGLSGLAKDSSGRLWAVSEAGHSIVAIDPKSGAVAAVKIVGVPAMLELESIAFLPNDDLVLGTESEAANRRSDDILIARRASGNSDYQVDGQVSVPYGLWGISADPNEGIEGMCATGDSLLMAMEAVVESGEARFAPIVIYDFSKATFRALLLRLTSSAGKISGIACRERGGALEFVAIERHYPVRRVLHGMISDRDDGPIAPTIELELSRRTENFEGIEWLQDGSLAIVEDNFMAGKRVGVAILLISPPAPQGP